MTELPDLGFMTDVKYIDTCCEADHLIGKEMKAHQEDEWEASLKGFLMSVKVWQWPRRRANEKMRVDTLEIVPYYGTKILMSPCPRGLGEACRGESRVPWRVQHRDQGEVSFASFTEDTDLCVAPWRSLGPAPGLFFSSLPFGIQLHNYFLGLYPVSDTMPGTGDEHRVLMLLLRPAGYLLGLISLCHWRALEVLGSLFCTSFFLTGETGSGLLFTQLKGSNTVQSLHFMHNRHETWEKKKAIHPKCVTHSALPVAPVHRCPQQ